MQSIGRGLRKSETKTKATLFDIADNLAWKSKNNFTLDHFAERLKMLMENDDYTIELLYGLEQLFSSIKPTKGEVTNITEGDKSNDVIIGECASAIPVHDAVSVDIGIADGLSGSP